MTIERIGPVDPLPNVKKTGKSARPERSEETDSINLSAEAKSKAEILRALEAAKNSPDIRRERVEEIKKKLQDPSYISDKVINDVADRLLELFGIT